MINDRNLNPHKGIHTPHARYDFVPDSIHRAVWMQKLRAVKNCLDALWFENGSSCTNSLPKTKSVLHRVIQSLIATDLTGQRFTHCPLITDLAPLICQLLNSARTDITVLYNLAIDQPIRRRGKSA